MITKYKLSSFILFFLFVFFLCPKIIAQPHDSLWTKGGGLKIDFQLYQNKYLRLQTILPETYKLEAKLPAMNEESDNEVFLQITGENRASHHGAKLTGGNPGLRLSYVEKRESPTLNGKLVVFVQKDSVLNLKVESYYQFYDQIPVVRRYTKIYNVGKISVNIEFLSSATMQNFSEITQGTPQNHLKIHYAFNSWQQEAQWKTSAPSELGWDNNNVFNLNPISFSNLGSWSTIKYLPMGMIENAKAGLIWFWQIEHNGSWYWELSNTSNGSSYLYLGGPDLEHSQALKTLNPGESYTTVPVAIGCVSGGFNEAVSALTKYRRTALLRGKDVNASCPVIFNDYMNCLMGNPLTENELPLINAAAKAACNYYVIDAGWYAEKNENWWDAVGLWQPSKSRFAPNGLVSLIDTILSKKMIPGLWLEPEVVGINSPLKTKPNNWFLMRNGKRIIDNSRYLLDYRNPEVRNYMTSVVDRLVKDYRVGYIKMDYNNTAWGADSGKSSAGQGLLEHNRAVVAWYKEIANLYPQLIIENCGSGGCRMDYAMLSQTQIQSSSDQMDYKKTAAIIVGAMAAVLPEQLAAWTYPRANCDVKETSFNLVNAMLCRMQLSGNISQLSPESFKILKQGIDIYKSKLAAVIPNSEPFFPLGLPSLQDSISPISLGLKNANQKFISIWRLAGDNEVFIPENNNKTVHILYPQNLNIELTSVEKGFTVKFPEKYMAVIVELKK